MQYPPRGQSQLRRGRVSVDNTAYFITKTARVRLAEGEPAETGILMGKGVPEIIISTLQFLHDDESLNLLVYVIMPDHIHVLFQLGEGQELPKIMRRFGSFSGRKIAAQIGIEAPVWQHTYYDRAVRNDQELAQYRAYIAANPIKAGYVQNIEEWPWTYGCW